MNTYVYDIECYRNYSCYVFKNIKNNKYIHFEISIHNNQLKELVTFLNQPLNLIGFNNVKYDNVIISYLKALQSIISISNIDTPEYIISLLQRLSDMSNDIINNDAPVSNNLAFNSENTLDLYLINHYNNKARSCSLKQVEAAINFENIQVLPYELNINLTREQELEILNYCYNDVNATYELYKLTKNDIKLRIELTNEYKINLLNKSSAAIGEQIMLYYISNQTNKSPNEIKQLKTIKDYTVNLNNIIFPYISYNNISFTNISNNFRNHEILFKSTFANDKEKEKYAKELKNKFNNTLHYKSAYDEFELVFGLGGIHGVNKCKTWQSNNTHSILDLDVASFYPNIGIKNKLYPKHLSEDFCTVYEYIYELRKSYPKTNTINGALKLSLNGAYGKSKEINSFLYDPEYTMSITINGQLLILMLIDMLLYQIPEIKLIQANTDGITIYYPINKLQEIKNIYHEWESITKLELEEKEYSKFIFRDVNNYIALDTKNNIKHKGEFEIKKELHKDNSKRIVAKALEAYFIHNIKPEDYILNQQHGVKDFFCFEKVKSVDDEEEEKTCRLEAVKVINGNIIKRQLPKLTRYLVVDKNSPNKEEIYRVYEQKNTKTKFVLIEAGKYTLECNDLSKLKDYIIDYRYYINETYKVINSIEEKTILSLF